MDNQYIAVGLSSPLSKSSFILFYFILGVLRFFWFVWCDSLLNLTALNLVDGQSVYGSWSLESTVSDSVAQAAGGFGPASGINPDSLGDHVAYALRAATGSSLFSLNSRGLRTEACWRLSIMLSISISLACVSQVSLQTQ